MERRVKVIDGFYGDQRSTIRVVGDSTGTLDILMPRLPRLLSIVAIAGGLLGVAGFVVGVIWLISSPETPGGISQILQFLLPVGGAVS